MDERTHELVARPASPAVDSPVQTTGAVVPGRVAMRSPRVLISFAFWVTVLLAADLGIKTWTFAWVAGEPVPLNREAMLSDPHGFWADYSHPPVVVVPYLLELRLTSNTGAVFGLGKGGIPVFVVATFVALGIIGWVFARSPARAWGLHLALALISAGALGNLYDRVRYAAVRDMFHMLPQTPLWPWIFNLADAMLMLGVGLILLMSFRAEPGARRSDALEP